MLILGGLLVLLEQNFGRYYEMLLLEKWKIQSSVLKKPKGELNQC